jgi:hypothetical protein
MFLSVRVFIARLEQPVPKPVQQNRGSVLTDTDAGERKVYIVPERMTFSRVASSDIIRPTRGEHKKHFILLLNLQFFQLRFPAGLIPRIFLQD